MPHATIVDLISKSESIRVSYFQDSHEVIAITFYYDRDIEIEFLCGEIYFKDLQKDILAFFNKDIIHAELNKEFKLKNESSFIELKDIIKSKTEISMKYEKVINISDILFINSIKLFLESGKVISIFAGKDEMHRSVYKIKI